MHCIIHLNSFLVLIDILSIVIMHNNCMFLAYHCGTGFSGCEEKIPFLRAKAKQFFSFMIRSLRTKLNLMINDAMTGVDENIAVKKGIREYKQTI